MRESDYKYRGRHLGRCDHDFDKVVGFVDTFDRIKRSVDEMKERVAQQPVAISLCVEDSTWDQYYSGILKKDDCKCTDLNHAVVIVGYNMCNGDDEENDEGNDDEEGNDDDVTPTPETCNVDKWWYSCGDKANIRRLQNEDKCVPHWIIQNSWAEEWGENGFMRIEMTAGKGVCSMNEEVDYAEWKDMY